MSNVLRIDGMVDPHCHLRDLQWAHKATFLSETSAAIAGGYWAVFDMPNTPPETITQAALQTKLSAMQRSAVCDWGVYAGASQTDNTPEYASMSGSTCGLKIFNNSTTGNLLITDQTLRSKNYQFWTANTPIAVHAEEETVLEILELVRIHRKPTHFLHISTASEIAFLRAAKQEGLPITIGVCPHHLFLTEDDIDTLHGYGMMKPPLKTRSDVDALWLAIQDGIVDVIESDHAPHTHADKQAAKPAYGVPGLETTLPLMLTAVAQGRLELAQLVSMVSVNPRHIWGLQCPPDTYTLIDLDSRYTIENTNLRTACGWTPFAGFNITARVIETWIRGVRVFDGENITVQPGFGCNLFGGVA
jgi:carbamoyl-phosphate synthase/aspartate carbamoyltransferase/dihydroorotase